MRFESSLSVVLALCALSIAMPNLEDEFPREFRLSMFYPRQVGSSMVATANTVSAFFTQALGGMSTPPIVKSADTKRPFQVGGSTFVSLSLPLCGRGRRTKNEKLDDHGTLMFTILV